jgi:hypothetical protein
MTFPDKGYQGCGGTLRTPFKRYRHRWWLSGPQKDVNRGDARILALDERALAILTTWKILVKLQAILVLHAPRAAATRDEEGRSITRMPRKCHCIISVSSDGGKRRSSIGDHRDIKRRYSCETRRPVPFAEIVDIKSI